MVWRDLYFRPVWKNLPFGPGKGPRNCRLKIALGGKGWLEFFRVRRVLNARVMAPHHLGATGLALT